MDNCNRDAQKSLYNHRLVLKFHLVVLSLIMLVSIEYTFTLEISFVNWLLHGAIQV